MEKQIIENASLKVLQKKSPQDQGAAKLDTVQDFLIKLGIKPRIDLWEISILSLNNVIVRPT